MCDVCNRIVYGGDAEVKDFGCLRLPRCTFDQHIVRLHITMKNAALVSFVEPASNATREGEGGIDGRSPVVG
jgi:hypothetical protein